MQTVEIRLPPAELPASMAAMREWLDEHRCEPASFSCDDSAGQIHVSVTFAAAREAQAFAARFAGRLHAAPADNGLDRTILSPAGVVG